MDITIKQKLITLPSEVPTVISKGLNIPNYFYCPNNQRYSNEGEEYHQIYILSSPDYLVSGDYAIDENGVFGPYEMGDVPVGRFIGKIVATLDKKLTLKDLTGGSSLPEISDDFIKEWIFNGQPNEVVVEYEEYMTDGWIPTFGNPDNFNLEEPAELDIRVKVIDGCIICKLI